MWRVLSVGGDLCTLMGVQTLVREAMSRFGKVDILINCAGAIRPGSLLSKPDEEWHEDLALKFFGYVRIMREVFPIMKSGGGANAALMNISKAVAVEGGPYNILVNGINPAPTRTERWDVMNARFAAEWGKTIPEVEAIRVQNNPLGRPCELREVAAVAVFLVSKRASYLNGGLIEIDGGNTRCI
jgi:NAD(P)-dependent dehydrogenase (short-subunit alcohol dehydrogenase family)